MIQEAARGGRGGKETRVQGVQGVQGGAGGCRGAGVQEGGDRGGDEERQMVGSRRMRHHSLAFRPSPRDSTTSTTRSDFTPPMTTKIAAMGANVPTDCDSL